MKNKTGKILMVLGLILILGAIGLLVYNRLDENRASGKAGFAAAAVLEHISEVTVNTVPEVRPTIGELPTYIVDGHEYIGLLLVPELELELPVMSQWSYANLKISPCMYKLDVEKNSLVIAAHNYKSHFGGLSLLTAGSKVSFVDVDGNEYPYEVSLVETVQPTEIEKMIDDKWDLSLFTCTFGGAARVTVRCMMTE